jgi:hypothetical protein
MGISLHQGRAEFTFLGPTPYLSAADSPFPVDGSNPYFYLEDFEDGALNTPGIAQRNLAPIFGEGALGTILAPGMGTDSVDADDGVIDGFGRGGHSMRSNVVFIIDTFPPLISFEVGFEFDQLLLGRYPAAFGVVWTDGPQFSSFSMRLTTGLGDTLSTPLTMDVGDADRNGSTLDDFFIGVTHVDGIANVALQGSYVGTLTTSDNIEIDHVQYGFLVPEPNTVCQFLVLVAFLRRRFRAGCAAKRVRQITPERSLGNGSQIKF